MEYAMQVLNRHGPVSGQPTHRKRFVEEVSCAYCGGRVGGDLICLTCKGVGMVPVSVEADTCGRCNGTGEEGVFYCNACKGQGIV